MLHLILTTIDSPKNLSDYLNTGGIIGILALILISGTRRWWVFGWQYKELKERYDRVEESNAMWMQVALRGVNISEKIIQTTPANPSDGSPNA